jgi:hypothetical protein
MNSSTPVGARTPVIANVDVLVFGAGSSAVAAALEAKTRGATVFAVSDRTYFGEESAGALELWPERGEEADPLFDAMFPPDATSPSHPGFIKRALEQSLLKAKIPFLFLARPVALLENETGTAGVVLASRTSLYTVRCRSVVDASRHGLVLQLAGRPFPGKRPLSKPATLVSLAKEMPKPWVDRSELLKPAIDLKNDKGQPIEIRSLRLDFGTPALENDSVRAWAGVEHHLRSQLLDNRFHLSADIIPLPPQRVLAEESQWTDNPLAALDKWNASSDGIVPCNGTLPLTAKGVASLEQPRLQLAAGRKAGALAADYALSHRSQTKGKLRIKTGSDDVAGTNTENFGFAAPFVRDPNGEWLDLDFTAFPDLGSCDVAVAGGGTGGAAAGISSARQGARTIVLEMQQGLGGVGTLGLIASYYFGNRVGFAREIMDGLNELDPRPADKQHLWNTELKMNWYHRALEDAGGEAWLRSFAFGVVQEGTRVTGLLVSTPYGMGLLRTGTVVDATGNADIAAAAGAPCRVIDGAHVGVQGTGLSPRQPGDHYRNSDHTFIDDCDAAGVTHAFVNARAKFTTEFDVAPIVNSRERRQIIGEIELSPLDFLANRTFPDTITTASSNFDTHGFTVHPVFMVTPPDKKNLFAHVPFRCLLPQNVEAVLVTGLGISAHRDAIPVVRMQADVENQGYAAGLASAMAVAGKTTPREIDLRSVQRHLVEKKILSPEVAAHEESFPLEANLLRDAVEAGPAKVFNAAVLFAHAREVRPLLLEQLEKETDPAKKLDAALVLGLMGEKEAAPVLADAVKNASWDKGWNFRGMGQFGRSMSTLDAQIIALARTESPLAVAPILEKIKQLTPDSELSHCRAVAIAAALLADENISFALATLLALPGMRGHAHLETNAVAQKANDDWTETDARTKSLRELHLARGLYLGGDVKGLGREILETYANDLRGHYARHARGVLAAPDKRALARAGA